MNNAIVSTDASGEVHPVPAGALGTLTPYNGDSGQFGGDEPRGEQGAKLRRYIAAVKRFRWLILLLVILGTCAGVVLTRFVQVMYEAHGTVAISGVGSNGGNTANGTPVLLPNGSWVDLFRSFNVVNRVVQTRRLFITPKIPADSVVLADLQPTERVIPGLYTFRVGANGTTYTLSEDKQGEVDQGTLGDSVGRKIGFLWAPTTASLQGRQSVTFVLRQPQTVALGLIGRLTVTMQEGSNFLNLTLSGLDKWGTADLLNTWMQQFVIAAADLRRSSISDAARLLSSQREASQEGLTQAEDELQKFQTQTITQPGEGAATTSAAMSATAGASDGLSSQFFTIQTQYENVQRDREALEAVATSARQGVVSPDAITAIPSTQQSPALLSAVKDLVDKETQLRTLRQSYTDEYPQVQSLLAAIQTLQTRTIPDLATATAQILARQERQLAAQLQRDSTSLRDIPARSIEEARLRRNLSVAENLYTTIENKYEATNLSAVSTVPDVSILDPAVPSAAPARNMKALLMMAGFGGSLAFGIALALLLDLIDHRFRYPEQISDELKLDVIGAVPAVPKPGEEMKDPEAMLHSVEAFRSLRMHLHHAFDAPPVMVTITSPGAGDGKSMIASNLALSFAEAGYRTLLIDGDIRRGKLHSIFALQRKPGLLDYLAGEIDLDAAMRPAPTHQRLTIIPSGTRRHRGPELLTSALLPALFNNVRSRFDVILVDSAPLGAGIDGYALSVATRNMILVMRTGVTNRRMAKAKLKLLERLPVRVLGAVVNDVPAAGLYQEYSYLYGYGPDVDPEAAAVGEIPMLHTGSADTR